MCKNFKGIFSLLAIILLMLTGCSTSGAKTSDSNASTDKTDEVVLYVTRHGKTMFNTVHRAQGWSDTPLTDDGVKVAEQLGKGLKEKKITFKSAYSSDAGRARETARLALKNNGQSDLQVKESKNLREVCFGSYEGEHDEVMWGDAGKELGYNSYEDFMKAISSGEATVPEMLSALKKIDKSGMSEEWDGVRQRMQKELIEIAEETAEDGGGNVLVVAHGMSILSMISDMTEETPEGGQLANASVTKIVYKDGKFKVKEVGNTAYAEVGTNEK
ncbi:histidine phosphatase family protein [Enterococcus avium]|uniref:histidine phosphatase family protein n=1 Tax=Enterococcus avium TaxID=33945 RepID=UPI00289089CA|nr:histidine phosphatase family protein [Enterococcus avium]MDT2566769.1 histidine phosphatase family protein [Enterococcus avium]